MVKELRDGELVEPSQEISELLQAVQSAEPTTYETVALTPSVVGMNPAYLASEMRQIMASLRHHLFQMIEDDAVKS